MKVNPLLRNNTMPAAIGIREAKRETFFSFDGYFVEFDDATWILNKDVSVPIGVIDQTLNKIASLSFRRVLAYFAKTHSGSHTANQFWRCKAYFESTVCQTPFSIESLISYRATLSDSTEWYMAVIRGFSRQWVRLGYGGITEDAQRLLDKWTLKGNFKGNAVLTMCPESGPLTDIEMQGIVTGLLDAYHEGLLSLSTTSCAMIIVLTGRRPVQVSALKIKDIGKERGKFLINFPRAKQRGAGWRSEFKKNVIVKDLWRLLIKQASAVRKRFASMTGQKKLPQEVWKELPLFPAEIKSSTYAQLSEKLSGDYLHLAVLRINEMMSSLAKTLSIVSERSGVPMRLNPSRFRYTLGTNLAREGKGVYVIAEALDHSDLQNAGVYVRNMPDIVKRIDNAVALQLGPIAQAFKGVLITSESEARRGTDPSSRISNGEGNVGSCGSYGFCGALAPIACYTCSHFQPWLNGPHEEVLARLIEDRDRVADQTGDYKIASINDRLILAVSDVIHRCKVFQGEISNG